MTREQENLCPAGTSIVVMGVSGSGKSTVGSALARRLGVAFADGDALHPAANIAKMAAGTPLDDHDRYPWLTEVGRWLADHRDGVISCSALKRRYRDQLRSHRRTVQFLQLAGWPELIRRRQTERLGHFMPPSLLRSQLEVLEPLGSDERGMSADIGQDVDHIVEMFVEYLSGRG